MQASKQTQDRATIAEVLAIQAGALIRRHFFGATASVEVKSDGSPVTTADREAEQFLRERLLTRCPDDTVIGEEFENREGSSPYTWMLDPIDGTKSFVAGVPLFTVLVAILHEGTPVTGVIHNPITSETVSATTGRGCTFNGRPTGIRNCGSLDEALVLMTDPADLARRRPDFSERISRSAGQIRTWADGYGYLLVATGRADAMIDPIMSAWDVAAMKPIITEAGGSWSDFSGDGTGLGESAIAAGPAVHRDIMSRLTVDHRNA